MTLAEIERNAILGALEECSGHRARAAKILGITARTMTNKIAEYRKGGTDIPSWRQRRNVSRETENYSHE
jgi:DNA-binding NtrC family response regulator